MASHQSLSSEMPQQFSSKATSLCADLKPKMKTAKIVFVFSCVVVVVFMLSSLSLKTPLSTVVHSALSCDGRHPSWMCDKISRFSGPENNGNFTGFQGPTVNSFQRQTNMFLNLTSRTGVCPGLQVSFPLEETEVFQHIKGSKMYIYSAFNDKGTIRIIGIRDRYVNTTFYCQIWSDTIADDILAVEKVSTRNLPESHGRRYRSTYIECPLPRQFRNHQRLAVSVSKTKCGQGSAVVPVLHSGPMTAEFIVCVPPLHHYKEVHALVESIEFKRLLGASKLVFYNHSTSENVSKVLHFYKRHGLVDVHQWHLPVPITGTPVAIHTSAQLAANNDCIRRYRMTTQYVVILDVDEFIIPRDEKMYNWTHLVTKRLIATPNANTFNVRNVFFQKKLKSLVQNYSANADILKYKSIVLHHTIRQKEIFPYGARSKCIYNPRKVHTAGIHNIMKAIEGGVDKVPAEDAIVQHYRRLYTKNTKISGEKDTLVVHKYGTELLKRLKMAWKRIEGETGLNFNELKDCTHGKC